MTTDEPVPTASSGIRCPTTNPRVRDHDAQCVKHTRHTDAAEPDRQTHRDERGREWVDQSTASQAADLVEVARGATRWMRSAPRPGDSVCLCHPDGSGHVFAYRADLDPGTDFGNLPPHMRHVDDVLHLALRRLPEGARFRLVLQMLPATRTLSTDPHHGHRDGKTCPACPHGRTDDAPDDDWPEWKEQRINRAALSALCSHYDDTAAFDFQRACDDCFAVAAEVIAVYEKSDPANESDPE